MSNGDQSFADRMSDVMSQVSDDIQDAAVSPGSLSENMQDAMPVSARADAAEAAQASGIQELFQMVQDTPFKVAEVKPAPNTDPVEVLVPAPAPRPPNTTTVRFIGPGEAMSFIATNPIRMVEYASDSFPDTVLAPADVAEDIRNGN